MDQKKRIEHLETEVRKRGGIFGGIDNLPPEIAEEFLKRVIEVDDRERLRDDEETEKRGLPAAVDSRDTDAARPELEAAAGKPSRNSAEPINNRALRSVTEE